MTPKRLVLVNPQNAVTLYGGYRWQPLSLAYVAAERPPGWQVELFDEAIEGPRAYDTVQADLVGITAFTPQAPRAYEIAASFRLRGIPVLMGGIHASLMPDEAGRYVDAVFVGECEQSLADVFLDAERRALRSRYIGTTSRLEEGVRPDRSIFSKYDYGYASVQTSRGCPMDCSFCSVTAFNGGVFRMRAVEDVIAELQTIPERNLLIVDDDLNGFSRQARARCAQLCRAMARLVPGRQWGTQVTINFGDDDELPRLAREAGCAAVFVGLESVDTASLEAIRKDGRSRRRGTSYYRENVQRIHRSGIAVIGSFMIGIETQNTKTAAADILEFAESVELDALNPAILTPFPGTRDYARFDGAGRIQFKNYPEDWAKYTMAFPVIDVPGISGAGLMRRYGELMQFFRPDRLASRYWRTREKVSPEAARHAFGWNRAWTNYALRTRWFRDWPNDLGEIPDGEPPREGWSQLA